MLDLTHQCIVVSEDKRNDILLNCLIEYNIIFDSPKIIGCRLILLFSAGVPVCFKKKQLTFPVLFRFKHGARAFPIF